MGIAANILPSFFNSTATVNVLSKADAAKNKGDAKSLSRELENVTNKMTHLAKTAKAETRTGQTKLKKLQSMHRELTASLGKLRSDPRSLNRPAVPPAKVLPTSVSTLPAAGPGEGSQKTKQPAVLETLKLTKEETALNAEIKPLAESFQELFRIPYNEIISITRYIDSAIALLNNQNETELNCSGELVENLIDLELRKKEQGFKSCFSDYKSKDTHITAVQLIYEALELITEQTPEGKTIEQQPLLQLQETSKTRELQRKIAETQEAIHKTKDNLTEEKLQKKLSKLNAELFFEQNKVAEAPANPPSRSMLDLQINQLKAKIEKTEATLKKPSILKNPDAYYDTQAKLQQQQATLSRLLSQ